MRPISRFACRHPLSNSNMSTAADQAAFLECLSKTDERKRAEAIADLIFQLETNLRLVAGAIAGAGVKHKLPPEVSRDLWGPRVLAEETADWLAAQQAALLAYAERSSPAIEPERAEQEQAGKVIH